MATGTVKWFNNRKGWGFVTSPTEKEDIFVHFSAIAGTGFKSLTAGQTVTFNTERGERGLHAIDVVAISDGNEVQQQSRQAEKQYEREYD